MKSFYMIISDVLSLYDYEFHDFGLLKLPDFEKKKMDKISKMYFLLAF